MDGSPRTMLSFPFGSRRFNYRVAGVAIRNGHVLVCREDDDTYVMLPGGRVELGERSDVALEREMIEELGLPVVPVRHLFTVENFFERSGESFHEIALYYAVKLPASFPFHSGEPFLVREDEGHVLAFSWIALTEEALAGAVLQPAWIRPRLAQLPGRHEHLIIDERAAANG